MRVLDDPTASEILPTLREHVLRDVGPEARLAAEVPICDGRVRVDLVAVNGVLAAYEIKSGRDSLGRLAQQVEMYSRCFEKASVVCASRYVDRVVDRLPGWWGIIEVDASVGLRCVERRQASKNPDLSLKDVVALLWHGELVDLVRPILGRVTKRHTRRDLGLMAIENLDPTLVLEHAREALKQRPPRWPGPL